MEAVQDIVEKRNGEFYMNGQVSRWRKAKKKRKEKNEQ